MKTIKIAVLKGDGIGPEVVNAALSVLEAVGPLLNSKVELKEGAIGADSIERYGEPLTEDCLELCRQADAVLLGAIGDPKYDHAPDAKMRPEQGLLRLRKGLGLYANIRPVKTYEALVAHSPLKAEVIAKTDFVVYRELTGGIYFGDKGTDEQGIAFDHCTYSPVEVDRLLRLAFEAAQKRRRKLTVVDKANVLETSRLWRKRAQLMAADFPEIDVDFLFVDNAAMQLMLNPRQFDVIATENMFGDILSDEASVIAGSIGLLASASVGDGVALFEPIHGSFPQAKGKNKANPIASVLSLQMLLHHVGEYPAASEISEVVEQIIEQGMVTAELNPEAGYTTTQVTGFIVERLNNRITTGVLVN